MQGPQLVQELQKRINRDQYTRIYNISVSVDRHEITLNGWVQTYYHKQMAQVAMQEEIKILCNGTAHLFSLNNEIEVA